MAGKVTGANGFVGSRLVEMLLDNGAQVIGLIDENTEPERLASQLNRPGFEMARCSLDDAEQLHARRPEWGRIDYLVHLWLKMPGNGKLGQQMVEDININLIPAVNLVNELSDSLEGICFASSVTVYGNPSNIPIAETHIARPASIYGATKLAIETYLRAFGKSAGIPVTVLRFSTIFGPGELNHRAIPNFIRSIKEGQSPSINGDGSEIRDYVYVDDVAMGTIQAMMKKPEMILNIGSGRGHTTLELAGKISGLLNSDINPSFKPTDRPATNIVCDISAAKKAISYSPGTNLDDGLMREIEWYEEWRKIHEY